MGDQLNPAEQGELLRVARTTMEEHLANHRTPVIETASSRLMQRAGAFVTLHKGRHLRGCIGTFEASDPLLNTVQRMAVAAATSDPRFPPVDRDELGELDIEISALSPLWEANAADVEVGAHGIYVTRGFKRGVLLPQVATENGWNRETFLAHTCIKAGIDPDAWKDPATRIELFTAEVFGEDPRRRG